LPVSFFIFDMGQVFVVALVVVNQRYNA